MVVRTSGGVLTTTAVSSADFRKTTAERLKDVCCASLTDAELDVLAWTIGFFTTGTLQKFGTKLSWELSQDGTKTVKYWTMG